MNKLISIIVPIFNSSKYLEECIDSIINQSYSNLEIILINDGSTDDSLNISKKYEYIDNRIKIINKANSGVADSRNCGLDIASGDYIFFVDSDDKIKDDFIECLYNNMNDSNCDVVIGNYTKFNSNKKYDKNMLRSDIKTDFIAFITSNYLWEPWGKLIKREIIKYKFDGKVHTAEDLLFWCQNCCNAIYKYVDNYGYYYRNNPNSITNKKNISDVVMSEFIALDKIINYVDEKNKPFFMIHYINRSWILKTKYNDKDKILSKQMKSIKNNCLLFWHKLKKNKNIGNLDLIKLRIKIIILNF